jgi:uncharacterized protein (UPF0216 family)
MAYASKYPTKQLKQELDQHDKRIKWLEDANEKVSDHFQRHEEVLDPMLKRHDKVLFGEDGDDGIVFDIKQLNEMKSKVDRLFWAVLGAIVIEIAVSIIK